MRFVTAALMGASICASAPAAAQSAPPAGKTLQLSKVILDTASHPIEARVKGGTLCVFPSTIDLPKEKKTQDHERFDALFTDAMKNRGFDVATASGDLFASERTEKGDYLVGATMMPEAINICSSVNGYKGAIQVTVEWQVYDRAAQRVVETVQTAGEGKIVKFSVNGYNEMWDLAFLDAMDALVEKGVIQGHLAAAPPASGSAAVPEAIPASAEASSGPS